MAHINAERFRTLADAIATDYVDQGIPLNTSVHKLASSLGLNHEQIRRLCETTNNATFNRAFNQKDKTASDRIVEFPVADADQVIGALIKDAAPTNEKVASFYEDRPLEVFEPTTKAASTPVEEAALVTFSEKDKQTARQVHAHLRSEKHAMELAYVDRVAELNKEFRRLYTAIPFDTFQKNALSLHGEEAVPEVNALRALRNEGAIAYQEPSKTAACVDDEHPVYKALSDLIGLRKKVTKTAHAITRLERIL